MKELQFAVLVLCILFYTGKNRPMRSWCQNFLSFRPLAAKEQQDSEMKSPSISIATASLKLRRQTAVVIKLRIKNNTGFPVNLSEPSSFFLVPEGLDFERTIEGYSAPARLWE